MLIDVNRIGDAVELDRLPERRLNHLRVAVHLDRQTADRVEPIESPRRLARRVLRRGPGSCGDHVRNDDERQRAAVHTVPPVSSHLAFTAPTVPAIAMIASGTAYRVPGMRFLRGVAVPATVLPLAARHGDQSRVLQPFPGA